MKKVFSTLLLVLMVLACVSITAYANVDQTQINKKWESENQIVETKDSEVEFIVKFKAGVSDETKKSKLSEFGSQKVGSEKLGLLKVTGKKALGQTLEEFKLHNSNEIEYIVPNYKRKMFFAPNDVLYTSQWNMKAINIEKAWEYTTGSPDIVVAVIDSGVELSHPDLKGQIVSGYNLASYNTDISDNVGHGTFVSGIIGAVSNNNIGIAGVNWNVKIMPLKVEDNNGEIYDSYVIDAIIYAVDHGAKVINISLGAPNGSLALQSAVDYAISHNVVVVAAVGNDGTSELNYPAACNGVIGVGSTNKYGYISSFSQANSSVDVVAPGQEVMSTSNIPGEYINDSGTSFSAPLVTGVATLLLSADSTLTPAQITSILESTSVDLGTAGRDDAYGFGRIDSYNAVKMAATPPIGWIQSPGNNQTISGIIDINGWFLDGSGVSKLEVLIDGVIAGGAIYGGIRDDVAGVFPLYQNNNSGYTYTLNTKALPNGAHTISIRETSSSNIQTILPAITVNINNMIEIGCIDKPINNQQLTGTVPVSGWFLDDSGVSKVEILVDGIVIGQATYGGERADVAAAYPEYGNSKSGYTYQLDTKGLKDGTHTITVRETNSNSIETVLPAVSVTIDNLLTMGCIDRPVNNQQLVGTVPVSGWVLDDSGVSKVEILVDGIVIGQATYGGIREDVAVVFPLYKNNNSGYTYMLNTKALTNGAHTISIRETNNYNIQTTFNSINVTINNLPTIGWIQSPGNNQIISGIIDINGWILDDNGVTKVEVLVDGVASGEATYGGTRDDVAVAFPLYKNNKSGYTYTLDTKALANGEHAISVRETSNYNIQTTFNSVNVTINNLPTIGWIQTPGNNQTVSGSIDISGWILDDNGVSKVEVLVDGVVTGEATYGGTRDDVAGVFPLYNNNKSGYTYMLNTKALSNGVHTITVRETSNYNSVQYTLPGVPVTVENALPIGNLEGLSNNQTLDGIVPLYGWFLDEDGVSKVEVLVDGVVRGQATYGDFREDVKNAYPQYNNSNSGFHYLLDTTNLSGGSHTITIRESSSTGLQMSLPSITIIVTSICVEIGTGAGKAGDVITVPVNFSNIAKVGNVGTANFSLSYDTNLLEAVSVSAGDIITNPSSNFASLINSNDGEISILFLDNTIGSELIKTDGVFAYITFKVKSTSTQVTTPLELSTGGGYGYGDGDGGFIKLTGVKLVNSSIELN